MKYSVKSFFMAIGVIAMVAISCNKESADKTDSMFDKHTCEMKLVGSLTDFDDKKTKSGSDASEWKDGSIIYLRMASPLGITTGEAVYNSSTDVWTISYYGSLYEGGTQSCSALYLEDKVSYESSVFTMNEGTVIYEDLEGSYMFEEGDLVVTANLKPKTGRIRFSGEPGKVLKIYGVTHYITYDINNDQYTTSSEPFKMIVGEDGQTPYFYGYFTDSKEQNLKVWIDAKEAYTRYFSNTVFNSGQSGKLTIPTEDNHNGWAEGLYFSVNKVLFRMIPVEGGTFLMGDSISTSEYYTAHNVTLTGYCIAETEMTQTLYGKLSDSSESGNIPKQVYYASVSTILESLNTNTQAQFNLASEAQWEYAAKGGAKTKGYKYAGSDNLDDVAWYSGNAGGKLHEVKSLLPNELGLYDMSGNSMEFVLDYYNPYTEDDVTDPVSPYIDSNSHVTRGGEYSFAIENLTTYARYANRLLRSTSAGWVYDDNYYKAAIRLALNWN